MDYHLDVEHPRPGAAVIRPQGRLNMVAAPRLREMVQSMVSEGRSLVVVDFSQTTFIDSSGLGALIASLKTARTAGGDLRLACVPAPVDTALSLTNLNRVLRPYGTVAEALA